MEIRPLLMCRPVNLDVSKEIDMVIMQRTEKWAGSIESTCEHCQCAVWVGPRSQALMDTAEKICMRCAFEESKRSPVEPLIVSLENPEFS